MQSSRSSLPSQMDGAAVGLEHGKLSAAIGLPAPVSGSGAQGRAPHPDRNAKLQAHGPRSSRQQLGGAQAQISVVERWWGPQIPGPFILPTCSS